MAFFFISGSLMINLIKTKDAFDPKVLDYLSPTEICKKNNDLLSQCLAKYKDRLSSDSEQTQIDDCVSFSLNVQSCYIDVMNFNRKCSLYLTMLFRCINDNEYKNDKNYIKYKCMNSYENLKRCNTFDDLLIQAEKIFGKFESNKTDNKNTKMLLNTNDNSKILN